MKSHDTSALSDLHNVENLKAKLSAVDYEQRLSALKSHNLLGTVLSTLAAGGHLELLKCIIDFIKECNRFEVYKLTDDGHRTLIHCAAYHHHFKVIDFVLQSLSSPEEQLELLLIKNTAGRTALDYSVRENALNESVCDVMFRQLTAPQRQQLIDASQTYQQFIVNREMSEQTGLPCM